MKSEHRMASIHFLISLSRIALQLESNRRPTVFKWWGRRPGALVRGFLAFLAGAGEDEALRVAKGDKDAIRSVRNLTRGKRLLDPFSGSGLIPIEASRLGYEAVGQDVNPYAIAISKALSDLCTGGCYPKANCLWNALKAAWPAIRGYWCYKNECIIHALLARCPPCTAPKWVSSKRKGSKPVKALVLQEDGRLTWTTPEDFSPDKPVITLPSNLPKEADDYVVYAIEVKKRGGERKWISLLDGTPDSLKWRRFLEETGHIARRISESIGGIRIPIMEETRRLYRYNKVTTDKLYTWRQNVSYNHFLRSASKCSMEAELLVATTSPAASLLAIYYQPLAKVNPGMVVKSYWMPRNPVELNPFSHNGMPNPPDESSKPVGRGTLISTLRSYAALCNHENECSIPPSFIRGDSTVRQPGYGYDVVATDPPYPGLHTYRDMSLFYAHAQHLGGEDASLEWSEIDTKDTKRYKASVTRALRLSLSISADNAILLLFLSSPTVEGLSLIADIMADLEGSGIGIEAVYPVVGEIRGSLGRARSKLVYVIIARKDAVTLQDSLEPLKWTWRVLSSTGLPDREIEYGVNLSRIFFELLNIKLKMD